MSRKRKQADLQATIEEQLAALLASTTSPDEGRMKAIALGIKYLAVKNKLEENEFGSFFDDNAGDTEKPARAESRARGRANGAGRDESAGSGALET